MDRIEAMIQKLSVRERTLALAIVLVVACFAAKALVLDSAIAAYETHQKTVAMEAETNRSLSLLEVLSKAPPEDPRKSPLWAYRQENSGLGNFIRRVSSEGESHRELTVRKISLEKAEQLADYEKTKLEVEVEGPFQKIGAFLEDLENSRFLTRVESVHVFRIEKELRLCRARILVDSYSWREP